MLRLVDVLASLARTVTRLAGAMYEVLDDPHAAYSKLGKAIRATLGGARSALPGIRRRKAPETPESERPPAPRCLTDMGAFLCSLNALSGSTRRFSRIAAWLLLAVLVYVLDVWLIGSVASYIAAVRAWVTGGLQGAPDTALARAIFGHPFRASLSLVAGRLPHAIVSAWLKANAVIIPLAAVALIATRRWAGRQGLLQFSSDPSRGTASWMERPYANPALRTGKQGGLIFGQDVKTGRTVCMPRPSDNRLNSHVAVFGASGSMKSRAYIMNAILQATLMGASVIVTDSKGDLYSKCAAYLEEKGYAVKVFNTVSMLNSDRWNLLGEVRTDLDAQVLTDIIVANTVLPGGARGKSDTFWVQGEMGLIKALALYITSELPPDRQNMGSYYSMITTGQSTYLDGIFAGVRSGSPARLSYNIFLQSPAAVRDGIISGMGNRLQIFQNELVRAFTATSDIDLQLPGKRKCAYFCIMPDYHSAYDYLSSLFFSFLFIRLIELADSRPGHMLEVPCLFLMDEFPNIAAISDFKKKLATIRSRNMHASIVFQDLSQLEDRYPNRGWTGIIGNCDWRLFLGANDPDTARFVETLLGKGTVETRSTSKHTGLEGWFDWGKQTMKPETRNLMNLDEILRLPLDEAILFIRGQSPLRIKKMDYLYHQLAGKLVERDINGYLPPWAREYRDGFQLGAVETTAFSPPLPAETDGRPGRGDGKKNYKKRQERPDGDNSFFPRPG